MIYRRTRLSRNTKSLKNGTIQHCRKIAVLLFSEFSHIIVQYLNLILALLDEVVSPQAPFTHFNSAPVKMFPQIFRNVN